MGIQNQVSLNLPAGFGSRGHHPAVEQADSADSGVNGRLKPAQDQRPPDAELAFGTRLRNHDQASFLCAVPDNDDKRDPVAKDTLKAAFAAAYLAATIEVYDGCNHGWTVRGSQVYNEVGAERAWAELLALYKQNLA